MPVRRAEDVRRQRLVHRRSLRARDRRLHEHAPRDRHGVRRRRRLHRLPVARGGREPRLSGARRDPGRGLLPERGDGRARARSVRRRGHRQGGAHGAERSARGGVAERNDGGARHAELADHGHAAGRVDHRDGLHLPRARARGAGGHGLPGDAGERAVVALHRRLGVLDVVDGGVARALAADAGLGAAGGGPGAAVVAAAARAARERAQPRLRRGDAGAVDAGHTLGNGCAAHEPRACALPERRRVQHLDVRRGHGRDRVPRHPARRLLHLHRQRRRLRRHLHRGQPAVGRV